jgi:anaerobic selenocysteine-containing dehydrogenase
MCPVVVEVDDGKLITVSGDRENPVFAGYTCVKGRAQPELYGHPDRLLGARKRLSDGTHVPVPLEQAMDEIADQLLRILDRYGPRAVAGYFGTYVIANPTTHPIFSAFMKAIRSPMVFSPNTLDKPGKSLAKAMLGSWMAPPQGYHAPDVALLIGCNPYVSYYGTACGHPGKWLSDQLARGMQLVVIDPRVSDVARRATIHLQPRPGYDPALIAAMLHVILAEGLIDRAFVGAEVSGIERLREVVAAFEPLIVATVADVPLEDLLAAARLFATAGRGYAAAGVGASMSNSSTLMEYLLLVLDTLCGHWMREGERVERAPTLLAAPAPKAQAAGPTKAYGFGEQMRIGGLTETLAGMPTGVLADEMLLEGDGQVRALISVGGAPVGAWPDQLKAIEALEGLDLFVQIDPWLSPSARRAHYVIAPKMAYEVAGASTLTDALIMQPTWYGPAVSHAQYTDAVVDPPAGSEVVEEWELFYGLAQRMDLSLEIGAYLFGAVPPLVLDGRHKPASTEILEHLVLGGRVPLDEVKRHPHGAPFVEPAPIVLPKDPGCEERLDVGNDDMMADLAELAPIASSPSEPDLEPGVEELDFRLLCRRVPYSYNSSKLVDRLTRGRGYNPAFLNPLDLEQLGLAPGDEVVLESRRAAIPAVVDADESLRRGVVSMAHGYGDGPERDADHRSIGSSTSRLMDNLDVVDRYVGMPRMSNIPVRIRRPQGHPAEA